MREKLCRTCEEVKPAEAFTLQKGKPTGKCKACRRAQYRANPEKYIAQVQASYCRNRDKKLAYMRDYQARTREERRAYLAEYRDRPGNRDKARAATAQWIDDNRERHYQTVRRRRLAVIGLAEGEPYTRREIYDRGGGVCRGCGEALPFEGRGFEIDHIVPISLGGPDTRANVQLMCPPCNRRKHANLEGQIHLPV